MPAHHRFQTVAASSPEDDVDDPYDVGSPYTDPPSHDDRPPPGTWRPTVSNVPIAWLRPHEQVVSRERVDLLIDLMVGWDAFRKALLVDRGSGSILDGHHRYYAAQEMGLERVPAALVDYLDDESIRVDVWPGGDHGVEAISKEDVIRMCLSADVFPPKTSQHTFREKLAPIFVPLDELRGDADADGDNDEK